MDLKSAFYTVVQEILFHKGDSDDAVCAILRDLGFGDFTFEELAKHLEGDRVLQEAGVDEHLLELTTEFHTDTFWTVQGSEALVTPGRGTRPGDPFGDLIFSFVGSTARE